MYELSTKNCSHDFQSNLLFKYRAYHSGNFKELRQVREKLSSDHIRDIEIVSKVLPFKTNNFVVDHLIDWNNPLEDPIFILNFPQKDMLSEEHYNQISEALNKKANKEEFKKIIKNCF